VSSPPEGPPADPPSGPPADPPADPPAEPPGGDDPRRPPRLRAGRGNGLPAVSFVVLVELDPRVADALLRALAAAGVAAYVMPSTGSVGGYLEVRLPPRPVDRVYVDASRRAQARAVLENELPDVAARLLSPREEEAFRALAESFDEEPAARDWPAAEDLPAAGRTDEPGADGSEPGSGPSRPPGPPEDGDAGGPDMPGDPPGPAAGGGGAPERRARTGPVGRTGPTGPTGWAFPTPVDPAVSGPAGDGGAGDPWAAWPAWPAGAAGTGAGRGAAPGSPGSPRSARSPGSPESPRDPDSPTVPAAHPDPDPVPLSSGSGADPGDNGDEGHYEPPEPPPLPKVSTPTKWALLAMLLGVVLLLVPTVFGLMHSTLVNAAGVVCVLGGVATLVARMRDHPEDDAIGPDDGAVV
jgi:hypothetical protein